MDIDFSDLLNGLGDINELVDNAALEMAQKVTLDIHAEVVRGSPVDTGAFRGAWTVETPKTTKDVGRIENTTVYGPKLVTGYSKQAPDGWLDNAVEAATRMGGK
jgi:hypothetical protein